MEFRANYPSKSQSYGSRFVKYPNHGSGEKNRISSDLARFPEIGPNCPSFMVAPRAAYSQIGRRKTLLPESEALHQAYGSAVLWLDIGLKAMQSQFPEAIADGLPESVSHESRTGKWNKRVITEIGRLKISADDFRNVYDARNLF